MKAKVMSVRVPPERVQEVVAAYRDSIIPAAEQVRGFSALLVLWDADGSRVTDLTLWQDEEAVRKSEKQGGPVEQKMRMLADIAGEEPDLGNHELLLIS